MRLALITLFIFVVAIVTYLAFWPVSVSPVVWNAPENKGFVGDFAPNTDLKNIERLPIAGTYGPEDVAARMTDNGLRLYTSGHDGEIVEINQETKTARVLAQTGGVPLGIEFGPDGTLYVADAYRGLLAVSMDGEVTLLTDRVDGTPILYADDLDIGPDGVIYFSDASTKFGAKAIGSTMAASLLELMEHGRAGRVLAYDPKDKSTRVIADGFSFSNGVAMSSDGQSILVNETGQYRVHRIWVSGPKEGQSEILIDNLPGFPDNINPGPDNTYLLGLISPRSDWLDKNSDNVFMRKLAMRLPASMRPKAIDYGHIVQIDDDGNVMRTWQDPDGRYTQTTGAIVAPDGYMYVSSLNETALARRRYP